MKIDRLVSILVVLLRRERVQAKELAEMFDVSVRTILRDIETINLAGIPIVTYQGANGGISIAEGYRIDKSVLSADDMAAILATLKGVSATMPDSRYDILMDKLKNPLSSEQLDMVDLKTRQMIFDLTPWGGNEPLKQRLIDIRKAIDDSCLLEFGYSDIEGVKTKRMAEPYSLIMKGQNWYLYAWCLLRDDFRLFKLSRMKDLRVADQSFAARELPEGRVGLDREWENKVSMVELDLLFEPEMGSIVEEYFDTYMIDQHDGKLMAKVSLPENNWVYGWLLSFGNKVEVINPPHIREILADMALEIYKKYSF